MAFGRKRTPPPEPPDPDRRKSLRAPLIVQRVQVGEENRPFFGYATNISRGGMFVNATSPKEEGSRFRLVVPLPEPVNRTIVCNAEVAWSRTWSKNSSEPPGMGIRFLDLPPEEVETIDRWIEGTWGEKLREASASEWAAARDAEE